MINSHCRVLFSCHAFGRVDRIGSAPAHRPIPHAQSEPSPVGMELGQLEYFVAVSRHGSLTRAAAQLRISQPALIRQIRQLEREVGAALFERTPTGMAATAAGSRCSSMPGRSSAWWRRPATWPRAALRSPNPWRSAWLRASPDPGCRTGSPPSPTVSRKRGWCSSTPTARPSRRCCALEGSASRSCTSSPARAGQHPDS
jgi:hypothetical protein